MNQWQPHFLPPMELEPLMKKYGDGRRRKRIEPVYREMLAEAGQLIEPQAVLRECALAEMDMLSEHLSDRAVAVVLAVCTIGPSLDERGSRLFADDPHKSVVLDEIGTAQIAALARSIRRFVEDEVRPRGLKAGPAYRPGVGQWPLELQHLVFERLPGDPIGVRLDENLIMHPLKSNSLIIPLLKRNARPNPASQ